MPSFTKIYQLDNPPTDVYARWISPQTLVPPVISLQIQATVGGLYKLLMPGDTCMTGRFIVVEPERRLVYSWQWQGDVEVTRVEVIFAAHGRGTELRITHSGFQSEQSLQMHANGWDGYLQGLREYLANSA